MGRALTESEGLRGARQDARYRDGRCPQFDPFDDGWFAFHDRGQTSKGVDGASYVGVVHTDTEQLYMKISSPGYFESVPVQEDPTGWLSDRASRREQPLAPLADLGCDSRSDREDQVLAFVAQRPADLSELAWMPTSVFTTHRRYELYDAMLTLRARGQEITPERTLAILERRLEDIYPTGLWIPRYELHDFSAYLTRLRATPSDPVTAMEAAERLLTDDHRAVITHQSGQPSLVRPPVISSNEATTQLVEHTRTQLLSPPNAPTPHVTSRTIQGHP
ncbi:hypothetical protein [Streptacidiphilus sp. MAP5-3]|uniref:hypothetical protein n=1 Tax=unclassified Streptacidiphilus TaxID=2643834 RepID=UPI003510E72C